MEDYANSIEEIGEISGGRKNEELNWIENYMQEKHVEKKVDQMKPLGFVLQQLC